MAGCVLSASHRSDRGNDHRQKPHSIEAVSGNLNYPFMTARWMLSRAGIINVYQYTDETLEFADGRLLLRGVNGSGKSTALNMLLPFLLEGDVRRIDAAGEQAGVLSSWMLASGAEDQPQRVGYLWIEFADGERYLTCGCGLRANVSSGQVRPWWFITSRRPDINLSLVVGREPRSRAQLAEEIQPDHVFDHHDRDGYRAEIRDRLFGGADEGTIRDHIDLLHIVRNPRVGDRIDKDLPRYLVDALPQLSDRAVDEAARPLEGLDDHRQNVADLEATLRTLKELMDRYSEYLLSDFHTLLTQGQEVMAEEVQARWHLSEADNAVLAAAASCEDRHRDIGNAQAQTRALESEISGLLESDAYKKSADLLRRRQEVLTLQRHLDDATALAEKMGAELTDVTTTAEHAAATWQGHVSQVSEALTRLGQGCRRASLSATLPSPPAPSSFGTHAPDDARAPWDPQQDETALSLILGKVGLREDDITVVREQMTHVDHADLELAKAATALTLARSDLEQHDQRYTTAGRQLKTARTAWSEEAQAWTEHYRGHCDTNGSPTADEVLSGGSGQTLEEHHTSLVVAIDATGQWHQEVLARLSHQANLRQQEREALERHLHDLEQQTSPPPPRLNWQHSTDDLLLRDMIEFAPHVTPNEQISLEAGLEAAGLLGASLREDGSLRLDTGTLVIVPGNPVTPCLHDHLIISNATRLSPTQHAMVGALLSSISTDDKALTTSSPLAVVTLDGRFRMGTLHGAWEKQTVDHVGVAAREQSLVRMREEQLVRCREAANAVQSIEEQVATQKGRYDEAQILRTSVPSLTSVEKAQARRDASEAAREDAGEKQRQALNVHMSKDREHATARNALHSIAQERNLPESRTPLDEVATALTQVRTDCAAALGEIRQAVLARDALSAARHQVSAIASHRDDAMAQRTASHRDHTHAATSLAAIEATLGVAHDEVMERLQRTQQAKETTGHRLDVLRNQLTAAEREDERAGVIRDQRLSEHAQRLGAVMDLIPPWKTLLALPGIVAAVLPLDTEREAVASACDALGDDVAAVGALLDVLKHNLPVAPTKVVTAQMIRDSVSKRRGSLGHGYDISDSQANSWEPVVVEVNSSGGHQPLIEALADVTERYTSQFALLSREQDEALRNLLSGMIAQEVAHKMHAAGTLVDGINKTLGKITTAHGVGVSLRWRPVNDRDDVAAAMKIMRKTPDLREPDEERHLRSYLDATISLARKEDPDTPYRDLIRTVFDYRQWFEMTILVTRPDSVSHPLSRRTALSEGEKKIVTYLPLFAAVAASCDQLKEYSPSSPRFVLLDDAFAKVSEDNHAKLFSLLVDLDLDILATSERLWGTHATVPTMAIIEVIRDAQQGVIVLEKSNWKTATEGTAAK